MLLDTITTELNNSLREKDTRKAGALRLLISELKNEQIRCRGENLEFNFDSEIKVLQKEAKKRRESLEIYEKAGRTDLADTERFELNIIESYLPAQMSDEEIKNILNQILLEKGPETPFGELMKESMSRLKGNADGKKISEILNSLIKTV